LAICWASLHALGNGPSDNFVKMHSQCLPGGLFKQAARAI